MEMFEDLYEYFNPLGEEHTSVNFKDNIKYAELVFPYFRNF